MRNLKEQRLCPREADTHPGLFKVLLAVVLLTGSKDDVVAVTFISSYVGNIL